MSQRGAGLPQAGGVIRNSWGSSRGFCLEAPVSRVLPTALCPYRGLLDESLEARDLGFLGRKETLDLR